MLAYIRENTPVSGDPFPHYDGSRMKQYGDVLPVPVDEYVFIKGDLPRAGEARKLPHQPVKVVRKKKLLECHTPGEVIVVKPQGKHALCVHESDMPLRVYLHNHLREELREGLEDNTLLQYLALPLFLGFPGLPGNQYVAGRKKQSDVKSCIITAVSRDRYLIWPPACFKVVKQAEECLIIAERGF